MKHKQLPFEFVYQLFSLILSVIMVHAVYVAMVRPRAAQILEQIAIQMSADPNFVPERSIILLFWAIAIMVYKAVAATREGSLLQMDLVPVNEGMSILPEDTRELSRPIQALPQKYSESLLPRALLTALHRFRSTRNIQDVSDAVRTVCESESDRLDSELSMVRYIAWAIPSVGFIGTVRGIGDALGQAHKAVEGDIAGVTQSLGVAFNSTFIALGLSIVLMFLLHQLQLVQERLVLDTQDYCDNRLLRHLQVK
jgi:biopolymer transport protein ExbB/TolQ